MLKVHGLSLLMVSFCTSLGCGEVVKQEPDASAFPDAIPNNPPVAPVILVEPSAAYIGQELRCTVVQDATDPDGDPIAYTATWTVDGSDYGAPATTTIPGDTIPAGITLEGQAWQCTMTATDAGGASVQAVSSPRAIECATGGTAEFLATGTGATGAIQVFAIPPSVCRITIDAYGAQGGGGTDTRGAHMRGTFAVTAGASLKVLVGQGCAGGLCGGGGTFVATQADEPLVVAGGGGSCFSTCPDPSETVGRIVTSGGTAGATPRADGGNGGGVANATSGGGGGFYGNGANTGGGKSFASGGGGGVGTESSGGYGGGGGRSGLWGQGGGGGFSGGSCGDLADQWRGCGGGGSFNAGLDQINEAGVNTGDGKVIITW